MGKRQRRRQQGWNTPIRPDELSLNDLAFLGSAASFALECHAEECRDFIRETTGSDMPPERLEAAIARAKKAWDKTYWDEVVPAYMEAERPPR